MSTHLQSQIDRLHRRIRMILAPAVIKTTDDTGSLLKGQININGTPEVIDPIGIMYAYGYHANPLPNTDATALFLAGDRSNPIIVATNHQQSRPRNYKPGEIGIYTDEGDTVTLNRENKLNITSKDRVTVKGTNKVALDTPLTEISKDVKAHGKIDASEGFFKNGVAIGGGSAGPPGPQGPQGPQGPPGPTGSGSYQAGYGIAINTGTTPPTISTAVPYLPLTGGTITGTLVISNTVGGGYGGQFGITNTSAGATNINKYFRLSSVGTIEIVNSAFTAVRFQLFDTGDFVAGGNITFGGPYLYGLNATGTVNSTGGPFIYFDSNYIIAHLGTGNLGFQVQNTSGGNIGGFASDGWLLSLGNRRVAYNDGNYTQIKDGSDRTALQLGSTADPQNYYRNGSHYFQGVNGATYSYAIDSAGITIQNATAFRGRKTDNTLVNLSYIDGFNNVLIGGYGSALNCFVGSGGSYFSPDGTFNPVTHMVLQNNTYIYGLNTTSTAYPLLGVTSSNRLNINQSGLGVDAGGLWTHAGTVFNTNSGAATGAFHMAPNASGTAYGSMWYNDGTVTYLLLTNNNNALGAYNGLRPFYVDNASGLVIMGQGLNLATGGLQLAGVMFANQDANYHFLYDKSGRGAILLGGTGNNTNYYYNAAHSFQGVAGSGATSFAVAGSVYSSGSSAIFIWADRTTSVQWGWYASGNIARLWNGSVSDLILFDNSGNVFLKNGSFLYGRNSSGTDLQLCGVADRNYFGNFNLETYIRATSWCYFACHAVPVADNTYVCGYPGSAWNGVFSYAYPGSSDVRLKHEIEDLPDDCLDLVRAITPRRYKFHNAPEQDRDRKRWGFIAQEVAEAMAARGHDFGGHFIGDDPAQSQALDHSDLLAVLWHATKELAARVAAVEGRA